MPQIAWGPVGLLIGVFFFHRRWISLLRVQGRRGDAMGLEASIRRLRTALVELGQAEKPETARLPLSVQRVLEEVQNQLRGIGETAAG